MNWKLILLFAAIAAAIFYVSREGFGGSRQGFQNPESNTFTMYYADWCGHCKKVKPAFEEFMKTGPITVGGTTCKIQMVSPEKEPDKAAGKPIKGFPTFLLETTDGQVLEYSGERTTKSFLEFINKNLSGADSK